jgi:hypothetical protein
MAGEDRDELIADLQARVARLEDERAILDTLHRYGQAIDAHQDEAWARLFTEDGTFLCLDDRGREIIREQGREALARWVRDFAVGETLAMKHCVIAPVIEIDGDTARVESYFSNLVENSDPAEAPYIRYMGRYSDEMARVTDGVWRFRLRVSISEAPKPG